MDDYYELLGVDEDAPVDDIRSAYRDKKAAVDTSANDEAKSDVAKLNKAWNVLSDPYQRGRYDQQRTEGDDSDDEYEDDDDDAPVVVRKPSSRANDRAERRNKNREPAKPTIALPAGVHFPTMRQRLVAMGIDLLILIGLFFAGSIVILPSLEKSQHREAYETARELVKTEIPKAQDATSAAKKAASKNVNCDSKEPITGNDKVYCDAKAHEKTLQDKLDKQNKVLLPLQNLMSALVFLRGVAHTHRADVVRPPDARARRRNGSA